MRKFIVICLLLSAAIFTQGQPQQLPVDDPVVLPSSEATLSTSSTFNDDVPKPLDPAALAGEWIVDLRPTPEAESYLKPFVIQLTKANSFKGEFYDTKFKNGKLNLNWDQVHFAFTTQNGSGTYFHSGHLEGDQLVGVTFSQGRKFVQPWTAQRSTVQEDNPQRNAAGSE